ncbi:glucose 1-dehydrogenase [Nonomuraea turkmeniaca]|uniref:Glucose 1-dehydrogenase n=1 Tax=Nonomuraea turkmeniaca TaxID=103838 RepID=A0A5S4GCX1_9ACTN|nr:glucose 1-dehydrogenase [Nonomuraea turkmeniaca]TMR23900.1 glucose 1-dehydrogenase [Nonomuraea turkmeniaca]
MKRFTNKTVLITGGTSGIGFTTARRLLDEGAYVVITGRDQARLDTAAERLSSERVLPVRADVSVDADLDLLVRRVETWRGALDVVFANAGIADFRSEFTPKDFDHTVGINFKGVFFTIQKALPLMGDGSAVVINASWTLHRGVPAASIYAASKAAVHNLARTLGTELAPRGIRVNSVSPGYIETEMYRSVIDPDAETRVMAEVPLGSLGHPDDVAAAVAFLASDDASYITGQDLIIDGGLVAAAPLGLRL